MHTHTCMHRAGRVHLCVTYRCIRIHTYTHTHTHTRTQPVDDAVVWAGGAHRDAGGAVGASKELGQVGLHRLTNPRDVADDDAASGHAVEQRAPLGNTQEEAYPSPSSNTHNS